MRNIIGMFFLVCGIIVFVIAGFWGLWIDFTVVYDVAGFWGIIIGLSLLPIILAAAPIYCLIKLNNSFPLILGLGGLIIGGVLCIIGSFIRKDN